MAKDYRIGMMKCKIHRATVTKADLHYEGSITVDNALLKEAGILPHEMVDVLNISNGERITTYAIPGKKGEIQINGAAAHLFKPKHMVIIVAYCYMDEKSAKKHKPKVVLVDKNNKPVKK
jgi:aspartate 1-decarboxylase